MSQNSAQVRVAVTGAIYHAPLGTTLPTDALGALDPALAEIGYISSDGVTQTITTESTDIKAWQNGDSVRKVQTTHDLTFLFAAIETTTHTLGLYYADPDATDQAVKVTGAQSEHHAWVLDVLDGSEVVRIVLPDAQVTERGELIYTNTDAVKYQMTLTAYPDQDGVKAYVYRGSAGTTEPAA